MKVASYMRQGNPSFGIVTGDEVIDIGSRLMPELGMRHALAAGIFDGDTLAPRSTDPVLRLADLMLMPVIPDPAKIICVGLNYLSHVLETGRQPPSYPMLFARFANSQVGHGTPLVRPHASVQFDYEGELAVVIGKRCRHVQAKDALGVIAGYSCYNDGSVRDWQFHTSQFLPGKNFVGTAALGPWLVTADEMPDPTGMTLITRLNGSEMQRATTDDLVFDIPFLIEYITTFTELEPGDVIATGTAGGVGSRRDPQIFMRQGDIVEVEISGIGTLRNPIIDELRPELLRSPTVALEI